MYEKAGQMRDPAATLESSAQCAINPDTVKTEYMVGDQNVNLDQPQLKSRNSDGRFTYATGSRPLDGYTIKRGIGIGGFGEVYFAVSDAGKEVALKRIQRNLDVELRGVQNCLNLKHHNLIALWDIRSNEAGESWVVMEYVPGPSLRDIVEAHPAGMPDELVQRWYSATAAGVAYLHEKGIVHRDLKPANIFLDDDEQVIKIGDYGLSKFISCSRRSGQTETVGTFHYMAPEIGKGIYGKEIDIYAMGIMLYEMLTGTVPFEGESSQEIIMKHLTADPDLDRIPPGYTEVIRRSIIKDPELRFSTVHELMAELPWTVVVGSGKRFMPNPSKLVADSGRLQSHLQGNGSQTNANKMNPSPTGPAIIGAAQVRVVSEGISFGPLRDTTAGTPPANPEIEFIDTVAAESPIHISAPDEPIARAVQSGWQGFAGWWNKTSLSTPLKVGLLIVASLVVVGNSQWLLPTSLALGLLYLFYYALRMWMLTPVHEKLVEPVPSRVSRKEIKKIVQADVRRHLAARDTTLQLAELTGSLLIAAVACVIFNLLGLAIGGTILNASIESWALYSWSTITCIAASWALLVAGKFWEHSTGDSWLRRLTMLGIGFGTGLIAYSTANILNVEPTRIAAPEVNPLSWSEFVVSGVPLLPAYLIFFTVLFGIIRWWRKVDPTRRTRLSVWSVGIALVWAAVFSHMIEFAPVWNCIIAVVVSISVQLAAPWLHPDRRQEIHQQAAQISVSS